MKKIAFLFLVIFLIISTSNVSAQDPTPVVPDQTSSGMVTVPLYGVLLLVGCPASIILYWLGINVGLVKRGTFFKVLGFIGSAAVEGIIEGITDLID